MTLKVPVNVSLTAVANLLAVIGVTGSLVFVGLELRQITITISMVVRHNPVSSVYHSFEI